MFLFSIKLIIAAWFLLWGSRAQEVQIEQLAGPAQVGAMAEPPIDPRPVLTVEADGTMEFENKPITAEALEKLLTERVRQDPATGLRIASDPAVPKEKVWKLIELANRAGIESIGANADLEGFPPAGTLEIGED